MKLVNMIVSASLIVLPLLANADDLKIANNTNYDLSFRINNVCSNGFGIVPVHTIKVIPEKDFNKECEYNPKSCFATVYSRTNCTGKNIAEIGFDTSYGVSYVRGTTLDPLSITASGFNLIFTSPLK